MNKSISAQRFELTFKAVHLQCLDKNGAPISGAEASGFIRRENGELYLYTCWHVVTGHDMHDPCSAHALSNRMTLAVTLPNAQTTQDAEASGNQLILHVPLYDSSGRPKWFQDRKDDPSAGLNPAIFRVPFFHNAVKLRLPSDVRLSNIQVVEEECFLKDSTVMPGDKIMLVGYPRGYGTLGFEHALPIVLTRFIAATKIPGRKRELLLDGSGAPGMSGGPVFIERDEAIYLLGLYTGSNFPNKLSCECEFAAALDSCCDMSLCWKRTPLQPYSAHI